METFDFFLDDCYIMSGSLREVTDMVCRYQDYKVAVQSSRGKIRMKTKKEKNEFIKAALKIIWKTEGENKKSPN